MTKETKTIKELKKVNHKLKHQYDLLQIRLSALQYKNEDLKNQITNLENVIEIKDKYFFMIWALGYDYDGYNTPENLKRLIDELVDYANYGRLNDDKHVKELIGDVKNV